MRYEEESLSVTRLGWLEFLSMEDARSIKGVHFENGKAVITDHEAMIESLDAADVPRLEFEMCI